jgi:hypothetical protein
LDRENFGLGDIMEKNTGGIMPLPSVPRAGAKNKNIFSPKNQPQYIPGAVVSP